LINVSHGEDAVVPAESAARATSQQENKSNNAKKPKRKTFLF